MLAGTMNTTQKIPFDFAPDAPLDGKLNATVVSGDATIEETSPDGLHGFIVSGETAGDEAHVEWEGDAAPGEEFVSIKESAIITITAPNATSLGGTIGAPVPKGETTTPPDPNAPHPDHTLPGDLPGGGIDPNRPHPDHTLPGDLPGDARRKRK
jgi:hypothetical protein